MFFIENIATIIDSTFLLTKLNISYRLVQHLIWECWSSILKIPSKFIQNVELLKIIKYNHIGFYYVGLILNNTQFQNRFKNRFTIWEKNTFKVWNPKETFTVPPREWHLQKRFAQSLCPPDVSYLLPNSN